MTAEQLKLLDELCTNPGAWYLGPKCDEAIRAARDLIASLPRTADGVPVVPGMRVWALDAERYGDEYRIESNCIDTGQVEAIEVDGEHVCLGIKSGEVWLRHSYSTEAAAMAAKEVQL